MEKSDIKRIIRIGEGKEIEYKETKPQDNLKFLKTVVAFSNCQGGNIVFGIEDKTLNVVGIPKEELFPMMDSIANAISDSITPQVVTDIAPLTVEGKNIILVRIPEGMAKPYFIKSLGIQNGVFYRMGGTTREADEILIKELVYEGSKRFFDAELFSDEPITDNDINHLCNLMYEEAKKNASDPEEAKGIKPVTVRQLLSWKVVQKKGDKILPNNAYAVLTGEEGLPTKIRCACFKGTKPLDFIDSKDFSGFVGERIEMAYQFVLRNIRKGYLFVGLHHIDNYEVPVGAIREAIINAVVHRSYIPFDETKIAVFDDRIEITSPGKMMSGQSIEEMKLGNSLIRNHSLAQAFAYMNLIEAWGSGIPKIIQSCKERGLKDPELIDKVVQLKLVIFRQQDGSGIENSANSGTGSGTVPETINIPELSDNENKALTYLNQKEAVKASQLATYLGISDRGTRKLLASLAEKGLVTKNGKGKNTYYALKKKK